MEQTIVRQLIEALRKTPMRYTEMRQFVWEAGGNKGKAPHGYYGTSFSNLKHGSKVIEKGKDDKYRLTKYGKRCRHPYKSDPEAQIKQLRKHNERLRNEMADMRRLVWDLELRISKARQELVIR